MYPPCAVIVGASVQHVSYSIQFRVGIRVCGPHNDDNHVDESIPLNDADVTE